MRIASRKSAKYCPYCHGRRVSLDTSIAGRYPELAKEWHFAKTKRKPLLTQNHFLIRKFGGFVMSVDMNGERHLTIDQKVLVVQIVKIIVNYLL